MPSTSSPSSGSCVCSLPTGPRTRRSPSPAPPSDNGVQVIIAGAGGSAHLPGVIAAVTRVPVIGVPDRAPEARRPRLAPLDRADAKRHPGRHRGDRRRPQRRPAGGSHARHRRRSALGDKVEEFAARLAAEVREKDAGLQERLAGELAGGLSEAHYEHASESCGRRRDENASSGRGDEIGSRHRAEMVDALEHLQPGVRPEASAVRRGHEDVSHRNCQSTARRRDQPGRSTFGRQPKASWPMALANTLASSAGRHRSRTLPSGSVSKPWST